MIRVTPAAEPANFDTVVRQPGHRAISALEQQHGERDAIPASEFPPYWRAVLPELLTGYGRICSYLCLYIPGGTGEIENGWFVLELVDFHVVPGEGLPDDVTADVQRTIERLRLNDLICREARAEYAERYWDGQIRIDYLTRHAPFVAGEMRRQGRLRQDDR